MGSDRKDQDKPVQDKLDHPGESMGLAGAGNLAQHNDWGHRDAGAGDDPLTAGVQGTGGVGHRHRDWGHSDIGNAQSGAGDSRQGLVPGEEAGELESGLGGIGSMSTGNAGSRQSEEEAQPGGRKRSD